MRIWPILSILCWVTVSLDTVAATFTVINSIDSGAGSLRQAVFDANASPGPDIIQFSISPPGPQTIVLVAEGLAITDPVTIDGATQPGFAGKPIITLVGDEDANPGIRITTSNCFIRALVISNFIGHGIVLETTAQNNVIGGTNSGAGNIIVSNAAAGVAVLGGTNNAIRGNSIFGNGALGIDLGDDGVTLNDTTDPDTGPNQLQNFPILTSATISSNSLVLSGSLNSRANTIFQIDVFASQACDESGNGEGQAYLGARSVTNSAVGTVSFSLTLPVTVPGRTITATATDPAGNTSEFSPCLRATSTIPPITFFVTNTNDSGAGSLRQAILDANTHPASGPSAVRFNIPGAGVHTVAPVAPLPAIYESMVVDGYTQTAASPNTLSNGFDGILLIRLHGTNAGVGAPGLVLHADNSTVRGLVIVGFQGSGIQLSGVRSNGVQGNLIGLDLDGSAPGNGISADDISLYPGLLVINSAGNTIGGSTPAARNIISANGTDGIQVSGAASAGNQVLGNYIGTDANGTVGLGNGSWGVNLDGATGSVVGGSATGAGNLISWNGNGVLISGGASNRVQGNFIGADVTGTNALGNGSGVVLIDSSYNQIGGTNAAARNVIVANGQGGLALFGSSSPLHTPPLNDRATVLWLKHDASYQDRKSVV